MTSIEMPGPLAAEAPAAEAGNGSAKQVANGNGRPVTQTSVEPGHHGDLEALLEAKQAEIESLAAKVAVTAARCEQRLTELAVAEADRRRDLEQQLGEARHEVDALRSSTSWRATAGLRLLSSRVRRLGKH